MDVTALLARRGEVLALALIAAIGGWSVVRAAIDPGIRSASASSDEIRGRIDEIATRRATQAPPQLAVPADHLDEMRQRLQAPILTRAMLASLTRHPDEWARTWVERFPYLYALRAPRLAVVDRIGALELVLTPPEVDAYGEERISDAASATWIHGGGRGTIRNHAAVAGYLIEQRRGDATAWTRLAVIAPEAAAAPYVVTGAQTGETYRFRARTLLRATGIDAVPEAGDVVVLRGAVSEPVDWARWSCPPEPELLAGVSTVLPVAAGERLYASDPGAATLTIASPDLKIALRSVEHAAAGGPDKAILLLSRYVRRQGKASFWCAPQRFEVVVGGAVGAKGAKVLPPTETWKIPVDLDTPYVLERIGEAKRVFGYDLAYVPDGKGRRLESNERAQTVDTVVLLDPATGGRREIPRLATVGRAARPHLVPWPEQPETREETAFLADPAAFVPPTLAVPSAPKLHPSGTGPLQALKQAGDLLAATDGDYFELPDGRLVYWEPVNGVERTIPGPSADPASTAGEVTP